MEIIDTYQYVCHFGVPVYECLASVCDTVPLKIARNVCVGRCRFVILQSHNGLMLLVGAQEMCEVSRGE